MASVKEKRSRVKGGAMPGESHEAAADRLDLLRALQRSDSLKKVQAVLDAADRLEDELAALLEEHGPGSGSPLARYTRRFATGTWDDLEAMLYNLRVGIGSVSANLPLVR